MNTKRFNFNSSIPFDNEILKEVVQSYMKRKGFSEKSFLSTTKAEGIEASNSLTASEMALLLAAEDSTDAIARFVMNSNSEKPNSLELYSNSFGKLKEWMENSIDLYRPEFASILYPVFVHCYLDIIEKFSDYDYGLKFIQEYSPLFLNSHENEVIRLKDIKTPTIVSDHDLSRMFRENKYNVRMSEFGFKLLLMFLLESDSILLLGILNRYLNIAVFDKFPMSADAKQISSVTSGILGVGDKEATNKVNRTHLDLSLLNSDQIFSEALTFEKMAFDIKEDAEPRMGSGKDGRLISKDFGVSSGPKDVDDSSVAIPHVLLETQLQMLTDMSRAAALSSTDLPSCCYYTFLNTHKKLTSIELSDDASVVVAGNSDASISVWDLSGSIDKYIDEESVRSTPLGSNGQSPAPLFNLYGHSGRISKTALSLDNQFLLSASTDNDIRLWSMENESNIAVYRGHCNPIWDLSMSPLDYYFATSSNDKTARLWSTDRTTCLRIYAGHFSDVDCVRFHPNCNYIATGSSDNSVRLWDVQTGECVRIFMGHKGAVYSLAFSQDGRTLASAGIDGQINLWNLGNGKKIESLYGHTDTIYSLDFSRKTKHDSGILASASLDGTVRIWDSKAAKGVPSAFQERSTSGIAATLTNSSPQLLACWPTKNSNPVHFVKFTRRNLLLAAGVL